MICCSHLIFFPPLLLDLPFYSCDLAKRPCPSQTPRVPRCMKQAASICSCRFFDSDLQRDILSRLVLHRVSLQTNRPAASERPPSLPPSSRLQHESDMAGRKERSVWLALSLHGRP